MMAVFDRVDFVDVVAHGSPRHFYPGRLREAAL
jgi:hypothetical protein